MPVYDVNVEIVDAQNRKTRKSYETQELTDFAAALVAAAALVDDLAVLTEGDVLSYNVSQRIVYTDTVTAGANVDEAGTFVVRKADNRYASHKIPMPISAIRESDGSLNIADSSVIAYFANFKDGGDFTLSDGELITGIVAGKLDR